MKKDQYPFIANVVMFLFILFLNISLPYDHAQWEGLGDPVDYLNQSKIPLLSGEFFFTHPGEHFFPRPFTVPLLDKIAGANPDIIIQLQRYLHSLSCLYLVFALMLVLTNNILRYLVIASIWFFMSWWNILGWSNILISESLSLSFLFAWVASYIILLKRRNTFSLIVHMIICFFFSFTRDTWPYLLTVFYAVTLLTVYLWDKQILGKARILMGFVLVIFFVQQYSAQVGQRFKLPLINSIFLRVLPDQTYSQWFKEKGMPCYDSLRVNYSGKMGAVDEYRLYSDTSYTAFLDWAATKGKRTYVWFLITHPSYTFFVQDSPVQKNRIWAHSLFYTGRVKGYSHLAQSIFPLFKPWMLAVLCGLLIILFLIKKDMIFLLPVMLALLVILNIFLSYNADAMEVERHMLFNQVIIQLGGIISMAFLIEYALTGGEVRKSSSDK